MLWWCHLLLINIHAHLLEQIQQALNSVVSVFFDFKHFGDERGTVVIAPRCVLEGFFQFLGFGLGELGIGPQVFTERARN